MILSTDGYWNGNAGYKLDGTTIGDQDTAAPRPYYDGGQVNQVSTQVSETQTQIAAEHQPAAERYHAIPANCRGRQSQQNTGIFMPGHTKLARQLYWKHVSSCDTSTDYACASARCQGGSRPRIGEYESPVNLHFDPQRHGDVRLTTGGNATRVPDSSGWNNASIVVPRKPSTCQLTDTGWVPTASCSPGTTGGQTVTCQTVTTGPTYVASCTQATANASNNYTNTSCSTTTIFGPAYVAGCTPSSASSSNNWVNTTCNPTSTTTNNVSTCSRADRVRRQQLHDDHLRRRHRRHVGHPGGHRDVLLPDRPARSLAEQLHRRAGRGRCMQRTMCRTATPTPTTRST